MSEEPPSVDCPNCGAKDLIGPISEGFMCSYCGWSFEYGLFSTKDYSDIFPKLLKYYTKLLNEVGVVE